MLKLEPKLDPVLRPDIPLLLAWMGCVGAAAVVGCARIQTVAHQRSRTIGSLGAETEFPVLSARGKGGADAGMRRHRRRSGDTHGARRALPLPTLNPKP